MATGYGKPKDEMALRAFLQNEFRQYEETKNIWADYVTKITTKSEIVRSPFTNLTEAKAHEIACSIPCGTPTQGYDELRVTRRVGNAVVDCKEEMDLSILSLEDQVRQDLYNSVVLKLNKLATADFVASATPAGTIDLSTKELVTKFLIQINSRFDEQIVNIRRNVMGGTAVRGRYAGKAFLALGQEAFECIRACLNTIISQSTADGVYGKFIDTGYGVKLINLGSAAPTPTTMIWGTAGVPTMAFRTDGIEVDAGMFIDKTVAAADSLEVLTGDGLLEKSYYYSATSINNNTVFANVQGLVHTGEGAF